MITYIGTKVVNAIPMTRLAYNVFRGWQLPADENGADEGFLIEDKNGTANTASYSGYVSWLPEAEFNRTYVEMKTFDFGSAISALKSGLKVARTGWNEKGLWLELHQPTGDDYMTLPYIFMVYPSTPASETAPANHINARVPWLASQTDMLATDWSVVK